MATTSSNLVAGKAAGKVASQGGNGNNQRFGLKAKLAAGVVILGCAGAFIFGGLRAENSAQAPALATVGTAAQASSRAQQRLLEQNALPELTGPAQGGAIGRTGPADEYDRDTGLVGGLEPRLDWATIRLIEQNMLPDLAPLTPPGPANFQGEDY